MLLDHDINIDVVVPGPVPRIHVKQGDALSRNIRIYLFANGEPWPIPDGATAVIRYHAHDPETLTDTVGIFDTLEDGELAYIYAENIFEVIPATAMLASPGLVTMDVVFLYRDQVLSTFDMEIYVERAPTTGTEVTAHAGSYYRVASLDAVNAELDKLRSAIVALGGTVE